MYTIVRQKQKQASWTNQREFRGSLCGWSPRWQKHSTPHFCTVQWPVSFLFHGGKNIVPLYKLPEVWTSKTFVNPCQGKSRHETSRFSIVNYQSKKLEPRKSCFYFSTNKSCSRKANKFNQHSQIYKPNTCRVCNSTLADAKQRSFQSTKRFANAPLLIKNAQDAKLAYTFH